ncbi:DUF58 domain-containing protein [Cellulomonas hominis]
MSGSWRHSFAAAAGLVVGLAVLLVGVLAGRPDVAALAVPALLVPAGRLPTGGLRAGVRRAEPAPGTPGTTDPPPPTGGLRAEVRLDGTAGAAAVRLRVTRPGSRGADVLVRYPDQVTWTVRVPTVRTGPQDLVRVDALGLGPGLATLTDPVVAAGDRVLVLPVARPLGELPLPFRLRGMTGAHESRRPGDGGGLRDVHPFAPGDSLRRIDWRVTARRAPDLRELYVRRTYTLADAVVMLVVDSRDEIGPDPTTWNGYQPVRPDDPTSLDLARQAAASVAQRYLAIGDRVGVDDLGAHRRPVPPAAGRRQLARITHSLALTRPEGDPVSRLRPPQLPSGALVVLFSTFLDGEAADVARQWRHLGHRVVAVDVLPVLHEARLDGPARLALRLVRLRRVDRLADLQDAGVEVVTWAVARTAPGGVGPGPAVDLARLARRTHQGTGVGAGR